MQKQDRRVSHHFVFPYPCSLLQRLRGTRLVSLHHHRLGSGGGQTMSTQTYGAMDGPRR